MKINRKPAQITCNHSPNFEKKTVGRIDRAQLPREDLLEEYNGENKPKEV